MALIGYARAVTPLEGIEAASLDDNAARQHHLPMPAVYTTPPHLQPVALWRLPLADGRMASATLAPTEDSCAVVWYLNEDLQDAAQFPNRQAAVGWLQSRSNCRGWNVKESSRRRPGVRRGLTGLSSGEPSRLTERRAASRPYYEVRSPARSNGSPSMTNDEYCNSVAIDVRVCVDLNQLRWAKLDC